MVLLDQGLPHCKRLNIRSMTLELQKKKVLFFKDHCTKKNKVFLLRFEQKGLERKNLKSRGSHLANYFTMKGRFHNVS